MNQHGSSLNEIIVPRSRFYYGPYGRMFRSLPSWEPEGGEKDLISLGRRMHSAQKDEDNPRIPAGYTYFGQFLNHDITFDSTSSLERRNDPNKLSNFRTPRFDLDSLYGGGPKINPEMYSWLKVADDGTACFLIEAKAGKSNEPDLPRYRMRALIGDPRNDEVVMTSQLHLAFIKFHNRVVKELAESETSLSAHLFAEAQRIVRWHYQWVVVHDFIKRLVGQAIYEKVCPTEETSYKPDLKFYDWKIQPFIPVEFSAAAFRIGHSMARSAYVLNDKLKALREEQGKQGTIPILRDKTHIFTDDLRGFRELPRHWTIQWDHFLCFDDDCIDPPPQLQLSRKIGTRLAQGLKSLPFVSAQDRKRKRNILAFRNLLRGWKMELPSGQAVAKAMGISPLSPDEIIPPKGGRTLREANFCNETPLWYYILREAELPKPQAQTTDVTEAGKKSDGAGEYLGEVGGTIVAEVLFGLLAGDPLSYLNIDPTWNPKKEGLIDIDDPHKFTLSHIIKFARMPTNADELNEIFSAT